jgi:1,4-dihydroxy-2-naphthoate octaprenyltransferase
MTPSSVRIWLSASRPKTRWAAIAPVLIGVAMAVEAGVFHPLSAFLALLGALFIQIGTNFHNDYADFLKGADNEKRKGPLRATQAGLVTPAAMKRATYIAFGLAVASGLYLMVRGGWPIVLIGVLSIVCGFLYTAGRYSLAYLGLGDLFVLIFFGPVAVGGAYYVQALAINSQVILAGLAPGLLSVAILLVNNIRDIDEDRVAGKKTVVVRFGRNFGLTAYLACMIGAGAIPFFLYLREGEHFSVMLSGFVTLGGLLLARRLIATPPGPSMNPMLGATARLLLIYSLVFAVTWNV